MKCNNYKKVFSDNMYYYYPILKDNNNGKEMGNIEFIIPSDTKKKFAAPLISFDDIFFDDPSYINRLICTVYFQRFIHNAREIYPNYIYVRVKGGKYVKFKFQYFCSADEVKIPFVHYTAVDIVGKDKVTKCPVCIEEE